MRRRLNPFKVPTKWCLLVGAAMLAACAASGPVKIPGGLYRQPSQRCVGAGGAEACGRVDMDCLLIAEGAAGRVDVEIFSTQVNEHVCLVNSPGQRVGATVLVHDAEAEPGQGVRIVRVDRALVVQQLQPAPAGHRPFCGARASLDGLRFDLDKRVGAGGECVPAGLK